VSKRGASPLFLARGFTNGVFKRGETPLLKSFPLPLVKGKGTKGIGFI
jgi:hypothetical protein